MAENCQYCGGRLKRLHPAHEMFCSQRPPEPDTLDARLDELAKLIAPVRHGEPVNPTVTNRKTVTNNVTTPELVTLKSKPTRAAKAKAKRAAKRDG